MYFYWNVVFTIILLVVLTSSAFAINYICKTLEKRISSKYLNITIIFILLTLMAGGSYVLSELGSWSFIDTVFVSSLCFFGLGWITNITNKASINSQATVMKFITNNSYKHQYEAASSSGISLYFISSLIFLIGSWSIAFILAYQ
ncbi:hypothetical protein FZC84_07095 [Rossellomorea vietnamensis]|uniref:Uncharacterized protein n=1 Tax=Rossellomorea vietnamensis TaxID=218284 RepID=A0A5D4MF68_9BACI|nr:hypothetical protein [Rossellomorea vietnamensis]TYS00302.1 hypothetical protein FZC84_07095 [Rossellomorea vietnamensis]